MSNCDHWDLNLGSGTRFGDPLVAIAPIESRLIRQRFKSFSLRYDGLPRPSKWVCRWAGIRSAPEFAC